VDGEKKEANPLLLQGTSFSYSVTRRSVCFFCGRRLRGRCRRPRRLEAGIWTSENPQKAKFASQDSKNANFTLSEFSEVGIPALCVAPSLCGRNSYVQIKGSWPYIRKTLLGAGRWNTANFAITEFYEVLCSLGMRTVGSAILRFWRCSATTKLAPSSPNVCPRFIADSSQESTMWICWQESS
jgi:hypothetical protein